MTDITVVKTAMADREVSAADVDGLHDRVDFGVTSISLDKGLDAFPIVPVEGGFHIRALSRAPRPRRASPWIRKDSCTKAGVSSMRGFGRIGPY
ncbi:MAG: hypothetical protein RLZZ356_2043 [Verrucomicrobiota bacterium]|jgi:hypothetical protein